MSRLGFVIGCLALSGVFLLGMRQERAVTLPQLLANRQHYAGDVVHGFPEATVAEDTAEGFVLASQGARIRVTGVEGEAPVGSFVEVRGVFENGVIAADVVRFATRRRLKIAVSALALLGVAALAPRFVRVTRSGLVLRA